MGLRFLPYLKITSYPAIASWMLEADTRLLSQSQSLALLMTGAPGRLSWKKELCFTWKKGQKYMLSRILDLQCSDTCCSCAHHRLGGLFAFFFLGKRWPTNVHVLMPICPDSTVYLSIVSWNDLKNPPNIFLKPSLKRKMVGNCAKWKKPSIKKIYVVWFHFHNIRELTCNYRNGK